MRYRQALRRRRTAPRRWSLTAAHRRELGISAVDAAFCPSITAVVCFRPNIVRQVQFRLLHLNCIGRVSRFLRSPAASGSTARRCADTSPVAWSRRSRVPASPGRHSYSSSSAICASELPPFRS